MALSPLEIKAALPKLKTYRLALGGSLFLVVRPSWIRRPLNSTIPSLVALGPAFPGAECSGRRTQDGVRRPLRRLF